MKRKSERKLLFPVRNPETGVIAGAMILAFVSFVGAGGVKAASPSVAPATGGPVVDLRTWPTPDTNLSKLPDTEQNRMIKKGQDLFTHTAEYIGPEVSDPSKRYAGTNMSCANCHLG